MKSYCSGGGEGHSCADMVKAASGGTDATPGGKRNVGRLCVLGGKFVPRGDRQSPPKPPRLGKEGEIK